MSVVQLPSRAAMVWAISPLLTKRTRSPAVTRARTGLKTVLVEPVPPAAHHASQSLDERRGLDGGGLLWGGTRPFVASPRIEHRLTPRGNGAVQRERPQLGAHGDGDELRAVQLVCGRRAGAQPRPRRAGSERPRPCTGARVIRLGLTAGRATEHQAASRRERAARAEQLRRHLVFPDDSTCPRVDGGDDADRVGGG